MRVGELLLQRGWIEWEPLALAIGDHRASGMRLCSFLIERDLIEFDQASRALGELHGTASALLRHLEGRDESVAELLPDDVAKQHVALPIGRLGNGSLIVCVRDPSPALHATLSRLLRQEIVLAVAPAHYLEQLVAIAYAPRELDASELEEAVEQVSGDFELPIDVDEPAADFSIDVEDPAPMTRARRASKPSKPPRTVKKRALSVVIPTLAVAPQAPARDALDATLTSFREIDDLEWLFDVAMQYISKHWSASLLLQLRDKRAIGVRGHGARITPSLVKTFVVDIADIALLELARTKRQVLVDETPPDPGAEHELLVKTLGTRTPIAVPLSRGESVTHVLFLADPIGKERDDALVDLGLLVESMGEALARM
jgi:hypothetical protein